MRAALPVFRVCAALTRSLASCALALNGAALCDGCARPAQGPLPGASDAWASASEPRRPPPPPPPTLVWDAYAEVLGWPAVNPAPFTSRGHQPEQLVDVRVSPESRASYAALVADTELPDGTVLAELPRAPNGRGYGMRKTNGAWSFVQLDGAGGVLASGALTLCLGCHAEAPAHGVFGLPRPP